VPGTPFTLQRTPAHDDRPLAQRIRRKLTSAKWAKIAKCWQDTEGRDIDDLVRRGILKKDAGAAAAPAISS